MDSRAIRERYRGLVPVAFLDLNSAECKAVTVRINWAKGAHGAVKMSELVRSLIDEDGWDRAQVAIEIGATKDEIDLLYQEGVFKAKNIEGYRYGKAWVPEEVKASK